MATNLVFSFGLFVPTEAASIEELGTGKEILLRRFPFVSGVLPIYTGFAGRRWRASCLISGTDLSALASRRKLLRELTRGQDILSVCGESFSPVIMPGEKLMFGRMRNAGSAFYQEVEMEFLQLSEER